MELEFEELELTTRKEGGGQSSSYKCSVVKVCMDSGDKEAEGEMLVILMRLYKVREKEKYQTMRGYRLMPVRMTVIKEKKR